MAESQQGWTLFAPIDVQFNFTVIDIKKKRLEVYVNYQEVTYRVAEIDLIENEIVVLKNSNIKEICFSQEIILDMIKEKVTNFLVEYNENPEKYLNHRITDKN